MTEPSLSVSGRVWLATWQFLCLMTEPSLSVWWSMISYMMVFVSHDKPSFSDCGGVWLATWWFLCLMTEPLLSDCDGVWLATWQFLSHDKAFTQWLWWSMISYMMVFLSHGRAFAQCLWQSMTWSGVTGVRSACVDTMRGSTQRLFSWSGSCRYLYCIHLCFDLLTAMP